MVANNANQFWFFDNNLYIAYLLGIYLTDANVVTTDGGRSRRIEVTVLDREIPEMLADAAEAFFGKRPRVNKKVRLYGNKTGEYWHVYINSTSLANWLENTTQQKTILPDFVFSQSREWKVEFLAGLLDGDGWATFAQNRYKTKNGKPPTWYSQIGLVGLAENSYINQVPRFLDMLGVRYKINYQAPRKEGYLWQIRILIRPDSFIENGLYFRVRRKMDKVVAYQSYAVSNDYAASWLSQPEDIV